MKHLSSDETKEFWDGLRRRKLLAPKCRRCDEVFFPPRSHCPCCLSREKDWVELSGEGTLYSWTEIKIGDEPLVLGVVELAEGIGRMVSKINAEPEDLTIGMALRIAYEDANALTLFVWMPTQTFK